MSRYSTSQEHKAREEQRVSVNMNAWTPKINEVLSVSILREVWRLDTALTALPPNSNLRPASWFPAY